MEIFRRHYKLVVWLMIGCFLLYLIPSTYFAVTQPSQPTPERAPVQTGF